MNFLSQDDSKPPSTFSQFAFKNWSWLLLASVTGIGGFWLGWKLGKLRCSTLGLWSRTKSAVGGAASSVKSGIGSVGSGIGSAAGSARGVLGFKKRKHKARKSKKRQRR